MTLSRCRRNKSDALFKPSTNENQFARLKFHLGLGKYLIKGLAPIYAANSGKRIEPSPSKKIALEDRSQEEKYGEYPHFHRAE